jgi:hypothetical protein
MGRVYHSNTRTYLLTWDGRTSADGRLNTADPAATGAAATPLARRTEATAQKTAQRALKTRITAAGNNPIVVPIHISVRVLTLDVQPGLIRIPVQLKGYDLVRALLLRIYDKEEHPIYHEYIDLPAGPDLVLPEALLLALAAARLPPHQPVPAPRMVVAGAPAAAHASTGHSLCRVEVWASRTPAALQNKTIADRLDRSFNLYMHTVSNEHAPTAKEVSSKRKRYGDVWRGTSSKMYSFVSAHAAHVLKQQAIAAYALASQVRRTQKIAAGVYLPRLVRVGNGKPCVRIVMDKRATSNTQAFTVADRIANIRAQIQEAEDALAASPVHTTPDDEVRIFIAPEWYFRKSNRAVVATNAGVPSYTHAEFLAIVRDLKALSLLFPHWLIIPGTIYWTLQYTTRLQEWTAPDMANLQVDILAAFAVPLANGNNGVPRAAVADPQTCFNGNVALFLSGGAVVHYQYKQNAGEAEWQGHELLTSTYLRREHHTTVFRPSYFNFRGLLFGVDICRDHYEHRCFYERSGQLAAIRTGYLTEYANAIVDVRNAIGAVPPAPLLPLIRIDVSTLLGIRQGNATAAVPGVAEDELVGLHALPAAGAAPVGLLARLAATGALIVQMNTDRGAHPGLYRMLTQGDFEARYNPLNLLGAAADQATFDTLVNDWTECCCRALRDQVKAVAARAAHRVQAQNLLNVILPPILLTGGEAAAGILAIGALALNPAGPLAGAVDVMLIVSNGTPNRKYGALDVAPGGLLAQADGATMESCTVEQIQVIHDLAPPAVANARATCATNMAAGGRALACFDIVSIMFDMNRAMRQEQLDLGNTPAAAALFTFEVQALAPLFLQFAPPRTALLDQLVEHAPRVVTRITVPSQAQAAVPSSARYDDANVDVVTPPTGRGGTLLARIQ